MTSEAASDRPRCPAHSNDAVPIVDNAGAYLVQSLAKASPLSSLRLCFSKDPTDPTITGTRRENLAILGCHSSSQACVFFSCDRGSPATLISHGILIGVSPRKSFKRDGQHSSAQDNFSPLLRRADPHALVTSN